MNHVSRTLLLSAALALTGTGLAAGTAPNTVINNKAVLTYRDALNAPRSVDSNVATVTVRQVFAVTVTPDSPEAPIAPARAFATFAGGTRQIPYTLTNPGNGTDSYTLSVTQSTTDGFDAGIRILRGGVEVTGPITLTADTSADLIIEATVPAGTADGLASRFALVATSNGNGTVVDSDNYAQLTVSAAGQLNLGLSVSPTGPVNPGSTLSYTFSATVPTGSPARGVTGVVTVDGAPRNGILLSDPLTNQTFAAMGAATFTVGAGNSTPAPALVRLYSTDGGVTWTATAPATLANVNAAALLVEGSGDLLAAGDSVSLTFDARVPDGALANTTISNSVNGIFDGNADGDGADTGERPVSPATSVTVATVSRAAVGPFSFPEAGAPSTGTYTYGGVTIERSGDTQTTVTDVVAGSTVTFRETLKNTGNATNTFTLAVSGAPAGWTCTVRNIDAGGTLGSVISSSVTLAAGATLEFAVTCSVPFSAAGTTNTALTVSATPSGGAADTTTSVIANVTAAGLPVLGNSDRDSATAPSTTPVTVSANPGQDAVFPLELRNGGPAEEAFILSGPTGTRYYIDTNNNGVLDGGDTELTGPTAPIAAGGTLFLLAVTPIPAGAVAGDTNVTVTATSTTDAGRVTSVTNVARTNSVTSGTFAPNGAQSTISGGSVVYTHTLTNTGNDNADFTVPAVTSGQGFAYAFSTSASGPFTSTLSGTVARSGTQNIYVQVTAPAGLAGNATPSETATIRVNLTAQRDPRVTVALSVDDTTSVQSVVASVTKTVELCNDATCTAVTPVTDGRVNPGDYLRYTLVVSNDGSSVLNNAVLEDQLPVDASNNVVTSYVKLGASSASVLFSTNGGTNWFSSATSPASLNGARGSFLAALDTNGDNTITAADILNPGATFTVTFVVRVN
ncbi:hypothetical protein CBQ26_14560 [Deinococcus indicus]|uniref:DUF11 domain-containing protein n=1 Tax=Deinococcus indicus TaxID=223556 RepID=A0A246BHM1_9DEIO|nr:DUF11 domain-containing protein [Deinococcus indicus]OWL94738.1 hypothetical protein CBQ26_14560 [Deinococcus indicus]